MKLNREKARAFIDSIIEYQDEEYDEARDITIFKNCTMKKTVGGRQGPTDTTEGEAVGDVHVQWRSNTFSFIQFYPLLETALLFGVTTTDDAPEA